MIMMVQVQVTIPSFRNSCRTVALHFQEALPSCLINAKNPAQHNLPRGHESPSGRQKAGAQPAADCLVPNVADKMATAFGRGGPGGHVCFPTDDNTRGEKGKCIAVFFNGDRRKYVPGYKLRV